MAKEVKPQIQTGKDKEPKKFRLLDLDFLRSDIKKSWVEFKSITKKASGLETPKSSMN